MQAERQHIDEFFRRREETSEADTSRLTAHWQQMQTQLGGPGPGGKGKGLRLGSRSGRNLAGILLTAAVVVLVLIFSKREKKATAKRTSEKQFVPAPAPTAVPPRANTATITAVKPPTIYQPRIRIYSVSVKKTDQPVAATETTIAVPADPKPAPAMLLEQFYSQIKKESEEFVVDADKQTVITGKEGTILTIPPFAFAGENGPVKNGKIKLVLTEFYRYDDIIATKLSTMSGGHQLVTGGMINLSAEVNGEQVTIASDKSIELKMPTNDYDQNMQLFTSSGAPVIRYWQERDGKEVVDTMRRYNTTISVKNRLDGSNVDWVPAGQQQLIFREDRDYIRVLNLAASPYRVNYRNKTTAKFFYNRELNLSEKELKEKLYTHYGNYYDKIKLTRARPAVYKNVSAEFNVDQDIIDSADVDFKTALRARLISSVDSLRHIERKRRDSIGHANRLKALKYYRFDITSLGWINCDRYLSDPRAKLDFTIDLGEGYDAGQFISHLIFTSYPTITNGLYHGSKIQFRNIPENERVYLVSVGTKEGKVVSCITPLVADRNEVSNPGFVPTTPEEFRAKMEKLTNQAARSNRN